MTHEDPHGHGTEHEDGPEHDDSLPNAISIPTYADPEMSDAPPLENDLED